MAKRGQKKPFRTLRKEASKGRHGKEGCEALVAKTTKKKEKLRFEQNSLGGPPTQ